MSNVPFLRFVIPFITGIVCAQHYPLPLSFLLVTLGINFFLYSLFVFYRKIITYSLRWLPGILINLFLFISGWLITLTHSEIHNPEHFSHQLSKNTRYLVELIEEPEEKDNYFKAIAIVKRLILKKESVSVMGKILLYLKKEGTSSTPKYGDMMWIESNPKEISGPMNPNEFDYRKYLAHKNIYHRAYVGKGESLILNHGNGNTLKLAAISLRNSLLNTFRKHLEGNELSVASALILGFENGIDDNLINAYSGTGVIHVLSVSGFHVTIIYLVFNFLLGFLDRLKTGKYFKLSILLPLIWAYAMISGLSPPVVRASAMISFLIVGKILWLDSGSLNIVALSAFLMLLLDPFILFDIGFQLSFLAVLGIVSIYPILYNLYLPNSKFWDKIWGMICISLAAQAATLPLSIYYFHKIPVYFLLANLIIAPLSTLIIYGGLVLLLFSWWEAISEFAGLILSKLTWILNEMVVLIFKFPHSVISGTTLTIAQCILLYSMLTLFIYAAVKKNQGAILICLSCLFLFLLTEINKTKDQLTQKKIIVHQIRGGLVLQLADGKNAYLFSSGKTPEESKINWSLKPFQENNGIDKVTRLNMDSISNFNANNILLHKDLIYFFDKKILIIQKEEEVAALEEKCDLVVAEGNAIADLAALKQKLNFKKIIFSGNIKGKKLADIKLQAKKNKIDYYSVYEKGAYVWEF